ncbi:alkaline phosphatase family protein [candidate division WOR-3 bacterium]|nr:alkaline phosphatase family protein [candidate division WOR-3 bacterium]
MAKKKPENIMPDYEGGSIVNLMSSILSAFDSDPEYENLRALASEEIGESKNVVLLIIDGLGHEYLQSYGKDTIFAEHQKDTITSVFPATTATAVTTFATGVAPQQHGVTGWFMYLKELGVVSTILPFAPRFGGVSFGQLGINPRKILNQTTVFERIKAHSYHVAPKDISDSDYTRTMSAGSQSVPYANLQGLFSSIEETIRSNDEQKYIYAYWPLLDTLCHKNGTGSPEAQKHLKELNTHVQAFLERIKGTGSLVIITADHGLMNTDSNHTIKVQQHHDLMRMLTLPVCGEPRVGYCYVHPSCVEEFESYVVENLDEMCNVKRGEDLINEDYFGRFEPHPMLFERIGDYVMIMKGKYVIRDFVIGEHTYYFAGNHGGMSPEEMLVPLITIKT